MITVPKRPGAAAPQQSQVPEQYLMLAAAIMHEQGKFDPPSDDKKASDASPSNRR